MQDVRISLFIGFISMLGLGGGSWYINLFLGLGLNPHESTQTQNLLVMAGSIATVLECSLNGVFLYGYALTLGLAGVLGAYGGIKGVYVLIRVFKR